jgi:hypothetical protein
VPIGNCQALRRDGKPCASRAATVADEFCSHHLKMIELHGEEAVRAGRIPRRRKPRSEEPVVLIESAATNGSGSIDPARVRPALAQAAADSLDEIQRALLDAALGAARPHWITTPPCPDCGRKQRVEIRVRDVRARVAAVELLLKEGLGRAPQAEETPTPRLPRSVEAIKQMSWDDMCFVFASTFVSEIAAAGNGEREALLRERVASLSEGERRVLSQALAEVA